MEVTSDKDKSGRVSDRLSSEDARSANLEHEGGKSQTSGRPLRPDDPIVGLRHLLETHSIVAMCVDKPYQEIKPLLRALADEVERLRDLVVHMHVHSGYRDNGYMQMTTPQKALYDAIWQRSVEQLDAEEENHHANS